MCIWHASVVMRWYLEAFTLVRLFAVKGSRTMPGACAEHRGVLHYSGFLERGLFQVGIVAHICVGFAAQVCD